jgi:ribosomal protein S18 acetylase RimI-like enzyme
MKGTHQIAGLLLAPLFMLATSCHHDNLPPRLTQQQITDYCKALSGEYEGAYHILYTDSTSKQWQNEAGHTVKGEYDSIIAFYDDATERTPDMTVYARWSKRKHPTLEGIKAYIEEGSMYLYKEQSVIVGAMSVTMYQGEDYHAIEWSQQVSDDKVAVLHILAINPDYQKKGIGSEMVRKAINLAKEKGMQAIRLDALASNTPAHKMYERLGFEYRGKQHLYAENTGWTDFYFFELK